MGDVSLTRHWLAYRERWKDEPKVITPRDDDDVAEWRRLGYRVEGPFVPEADAGAVVLSDKAKAFLLGTVRHLNEIKILPADSPQALETSAWLEEIEAAIIRAGGQ